MQRDLERARVGVGSEGVEVCARQLKIVGRGRRALLGLQTDAELIGASDDRECLEGAGHRRLVPPSTSC